MKFFGNDYCHFDQLNMFKEELTKYDIKEGNLSFPPTYKYIKNILYKKKKKYKKNNLFKFKKKKN